jgi:high affinity Mn2+ porin
LSRVSGSPLNDRPEQIFETYHAYSIHKRFTFTADYPFITNPAYNADRCPVSVFSGRLHREF